MPFCSSCGKTVHERDIFCATCGTRQPVGAGFQANAPAADPLAGISPRLASVLCYIPAIGWIPAVIVLASRKFRDNAAVRFHAFQGLYLFAAWLLVEWAIRPMAYAMGQPMFFTGRALQGLIMALWIFMMIKASHDEAYSLPVIGELAQRSAAEK